MNRSPVSRAWLVFLAVAFLAAGALRLSWLEDIEYKYDEQFMFERSQNVGRSESWPSLGMYSGAFLGPPEQLEAHPERIIRNPPLSIWTFVALARVFNAETPVELSRAVAILNVLAVGLLIFFALRVVPEAEREPWLWAAVLAAVSPSGVQLQRKIWAQSVLPLFTVFSLIAWRYREKRLGAFSWALLGMLMGQVHMSGFFLLAGWAIWTILFDRRRRKIRWLWFSAGVLVGLVPMLPWLQYLFETLQAAHGSGGGGGLKPLSFQFWNLWLQDGWGASITVVRDWSFEQLYRDFPLGESLGGPNFAEFLHYPLVDGAALYLVANASLLLWLAGFGILLIGVWGLLRDWRSIPRRFKGQQSPTGMVQSGTLWGTGLLLSLVAGKRIFRHYFLVAFSLPQVWLARMALSWPRAGRALLFIVWLMQLAISGQFLYYIHVNGGARGGDYGVAYSAQSGLPATQR